jgi:hypothetical protein
MNQRAHAEPAGPAASRRTTSARELPHPAPGVMCRDIVSYASLSCWMVSASGCEVGCRVHRFAYQEDLVSHADVALTHVLAVTVETRLRAERPRLGWPIGPAGHKTSWPHRTVSSRPRQSAAAAANEPRSRHRAVPRRRSIGWDAGVSGGRCNSPRYVEHEDGPDRAHGGCGD